MIGKKSDWPASLYTKKNHYYRGLAEWRNEKGWLTDTCLDGEDTFKGLLDLLGIEH